jgi:hypothetical protein
MNDERTHQQMALHDGRMYGYAEHGLPEWKPVFYFHGFPSSRLDWRPSPTTSPSEGSVSESSHRIDPGMASRISSRLENFWIGLKTQLSWQTIF